jgi:hypothetical protein
MALTVCEECGRTWQQGGGQPTGVPAEVGERAFCDAHVFHLRDTEPGVTHVGVSADANEPTATPNLAGSTRPVTDAGASESPELVGVPAVVTHVGAHAAPLGGSPTAVTQAGRVRQTVTPAVRRAVVHRDGGRCRVPGCSNHIWTDVHHVQLRSDGGRHDPDNLISICDAHHRAVHRGYLLIEGTPSAGLSFLHADGTRYGDDAHPATVGAFGDAYAALRNLDVREAEAKRLLARVRAQLGADATAVDLVRAALRARYAA